MSEPIAWKSSLGPRSKSMKVRCYRCRPWPPCRIGIASLSPRRPHLSIPHSSPQIKSITTCISSRWAHAYGRTQQSRELSFPPDHLGPWPGTPPLEESHSRTSLIEKEEDARRKERSQQDAEGIFGTQKSEAIMSYLKVSENERFQGFQDLLFHVSFAVTAL